MKRIAWSIIVVAASSYGCSGGGCAGMEPIPGGFPANERTNNAAQVRVSNSGIAAITADPAALLGGLLGGMGLEFDVPADCGGSPAVCCPGGNPQSPCGPVVIDLEERPGDPPRLVVTPVQGAGRLDVTVRARVRTESDIPVDIPLIGECGVEIDTMPGSNPDIRLDIPMTFQQDNAAGTTRIEVGDATVSQLTTDDVSLNGGFGCALANLGLGFFIDTLASTFTDAIGGAIGDQLCKACPSGNVAECGQFAATCTDEVCMKPNDTCLQELGLTGRLIGNRLFGNFSPGTTGGMDLYEVAGGYATSNNNGIALGLLGGMLPAGAERDRCGPPATAPSPVTIQQSPFFQGNTRPDNGQGFDIAIGLHQSQLDEMAYAAYDGGLLCLTISTRSIDLLTTDTIALIAPSLANLVTATSPVAVGLRPQSPPSIVLGLNTFIDQGGEQVVDEPLLDISFTAMEIDFFASIDGHFVRIFTLVSDVRLPIGLQVADGELVPVIGEVDGAFTNISVKNSEALLETPDDLAARFPSILELALPQLGAGLGGFALPALGGLQLDVTAITAVDQKRFLAIFADLSIAMARGTPVETRASVVDIVEPGDGVLNDPAAWRKDNRPRAVLELAGEGLEWQVRVDGGMWTPWSAKPRRTIAPASFWLQGMHTVEVRAREIGRDGTTDPTPVVLQVPIGSIPGAAVTEATAAKQGFHGQAGEGGCNCATGGSPTAGLPIVLALGAVVWPRRRRRRTTMAVRRGLPWWLWTGAIVGALLAGPGCSCGSKPCGDEECLEGEVTHSSGKWNGAASDGNRTVVSTYDPLLGDLVVVDVAGTELRFTAVDGIPDEAAAYEPSGYRGGIANPGPDVGAWSSIALREGRARAAYQDRETGALRVAIEHGEGDWESYQLDDSGTHTSIAVTGNGTVVVAYLATGIPDTAGVKSELRLALASSGEPDNGDWSFSTIASAPASCAGACAAGLSCVEPANAGEPEVCAAPTSDCTTACGDGEVCVSGSCRAEIPEPAFVDVPTGTGLFPTVATLPDGRLVVVHYDRVRTALVLLAEDSTGSGTFTETVLDGASVDDRGLWASAVVDTAGTVHVAYQDALGDQVFYVTWASGAAGAVELVDDGVRAGDRTHPVGAGASIALVGGAPVIAYQDGLTSDVVVAHRGGSGWTHDALGGGGLALDGFHIAMAGGVIAWDQLDHNRAPPSMLQVAPTP